MWNKKLFAVPRGSPKSIIELEIDAEIPPGIIQNSVRLRQKMQSDGQNLYLKPHRIYRKIMRKSMILVPRGTQNQPNGAQESSESDLGSKSVLGPQKVSTPGARHALLGTIWAILGAILGTPGRQGVPKIKSSGTKMLQNIKT